MGRRSYMFQRSLYMSWSQQPAIRLACQHHCHQRTQVAEPVPAAVAVRPDVLAEVQPAVRPDVPADAPADAPADVQTNGQPDGRASERTDVQVGMRMSGRVGVRKSVQKVAVSTVLLVTVVLCSMEAVKRKVMETPAVAMWASGPSIQFQQASAQAVASTAVVALVQQQVGTWVSVPAWPPPLQQQLPH